MAKPVTYCTLDNCGRIHKGHGLCEMHLQRKKRLGVTELPAKLTPIERFHNYISSTVDESYPECHNWGGAINADGYGIFAPGNKNETNLAHRWIYQKVHGVLQANQPVDHTCHNRRCVNVGHMQHVSIGENTENFSGNHARNTSGYRGAYWCKKRNKWYAAVTHNYKHYYLGTFQTAQEAGEAARLKRLELHTNNLLDRI